MNHLNALAEDLEYIWQKIAVILEKFSNKKIFISGATGFFGCWILETLLWANVNYNLNIDIVVLTRDKHKFIAKAPRLSQQANLYLLEGDIRNFKLDYQDEYAAIIHAATDACAALNQHNPILMFDTIVQGTQRILDFAITNTTEKFLYISSGAIYGDQPENLSHIPETFCGSPDLLNPLSAYAQAKRAAEHCCILYAKQYRLDVKIARCFAFVGAYLPLKSHFAIGNFIADKLSHQKIVIKSDGTSVRSYQYAADLVIWLFTILARGETARPYNVGCEQAYTIAEIARCVANCGEPYVPVIIEKSFLKPKVTHRYIPSVARAKCELGLVNTVNLEESVKRTMTWNMQTRRKIK